MCPSCHAPPLELAAAAAAAAAAAGAASNAEPEAPPLGTQLVNGSAVVCCDDPPYALLAAANAYNKKGTKGAKLPEIFDMNLSGLSASIPVAALWAALRRSGGLHLVRVAAGSMHMQLHVAAWLKWPQAACACIMVKWPYAGMRKGQSVGGNQSPTFPAYAAKGLKPFFSDDPFLPCQVRARGTLSTVIRELPGQQQFPDRLIVALEQRISTWFLPMYGFSEAEELGRLDPAALQGTHPSLQLHVPCKQQCQSCGCLAVLFSSKHGAPVASCRRCPVFSCAGRCVGDWHPSRGAGLAG
jgi:hypothetical protein